MSGEVAIFMTAVEEFVNTNGCDTPSTLLNGIEISCKYSEFKDKYNVLDNVAKQILIKRRQLEFFSNRGLTWDGQGSYTRIHVNLNAFKLFAESQGIQDDKQKQVSKKRGPYRGNDEYNVTVGKRKFGDTVIPDILEQLGNIFSTRHNGQWTELECSTYYDNFMQKANKMKPSGDVSMTVGDKDLLKVAGSVKTFIRDTQNLRKGGSKSKLMQRSVNMAIAMASYKSDMSSSKLSKVLGVDKRSPGFRATRSSLFLLHRWQHRCLRQLLEKKKLMAIVVRMMIVLLMIVMIWGRIRRVVTPVRVRGIAAIAVRPVLKRVTETKKVQSRVTQRLPNKTYQESALAMQPLSQTKER